MIKKFLIIFTVTLILSLVINRVDARIGLPTCASITAVVETINYHDGSNDQFKMEGYSEYYYTIEAKITKIVPLRGNESVYNQCQNIKTGSTVRLTAETLTKNDRLRLVPSDEFTADVDGAGYITLKPSQQGSGVSRWIWISAIAMFIVLVLYTTWLWRKNNKRGAKTADPLVNHQ